MVFIKDRRGKAMTLIFLPSALPYTPLLTHPEFFTYPAIEIEAHSPVPTSPYRTRWVILFHVNAKINNDSNKLGEAI